MAAASNSPDFHELMKHPELFQDPNNEERLDVLLAAHSAVTSDEGVGSHERVYHDLYVDIVNHEDFWFDNVFSKDFALAEYTVGVLGILVLIRRQRGDVRKCLQVLQVNTKVLKAFEEVADKNSPMELKCVRDFTYMYNINVVHSNSKVGNKDVAVQAFREAVQYEIEEGYDLEQQTFGYMLRNQTGAMNDDYMTMECLNSTTDDFIWSVLKAAEEFSGSHDCSACLEPWICDGCGAVEDMCGDFQQCSSCRKAKYCGKTCQVKHWKTFHKAECKTNKNAPRPNVTNTNVKMVANVLLQGRAEMVTSFTGQEVSDEQKRAAFPRLVQFLKDFLVARPEFNVSNMAFQDARRDSEFIARSQALFEQQPGFEALVDIHKKPEVRAQVASFVTPDKSKELLVDEDMISEFSTRFVASLAPVHPLSPDKRQRMAEKVLSIVTRSLLDHPEYNSFQGFQEWKTTDECNALLQEAVCEFLELEGVLADES